MPVVDVVNLDGKKVGQVELADAIFGAKVNQHLLHEASRWYLRGLAPRHAQDQGKERSQRRRPQALAAEGHGPRACRLDPFASVAPWRHGPRTKPRDYSYALPKKMLLGALRSALSAKLAEQKLTVVDALAARNAQDQGVALRRSAS